MTRSEIPANTEVLDALATTVERETAGGALWCPAATGAWLRRAILTRDRSLPGLARRAVRLARAMEFAAPFGGYAAFLYRLPTLRRDILSEALAQAARRGAFGSVLELDRSVLRFTEIAMSPPRGGAFELDLTVLPLVAAYLDALHNMLGFSTVAEILCPALSTRPEATAEETGAALHAALIGWLRQRLAPEHHDRQCLALRRRLTARGIDRHDQVDDAAVLAVWLAEGVDETSIDGFRMFRSAARLVLAYRRAMRLAEEERSSGSGALSLGEDGDAGEISLEEVESAVDFGRFRSPLAVLATPPCDRVKWLTAADTAVLAGFLDTMPETEASEGPPEEGSLFAGDPPDPRLSLTVLRTHVFGSEQARLSEKLRRGQVPDTARQPEDDYTMVLAAMRQREDTLRVLILATAHVLIRNGRVQGIGLTVDLAPKAIKGLSRQLLEAGVPASGLTSALAKAIDDSRDGEVRALAGSMSAAYRSVNRAGFRPADTADADMIEALDLGAPWLPRLKEQIGRIVASLSRRDLGRDFQSDAETFAGAFDRLYRGAG